MPELPKGELIRRLNVVACDRLDFIEERGLESDFITWLATRERATNGT